MNDKDSLAIYLNDVENIFAHKTSALKATIPKTSGYLFIIQIHHKFCLLGLTEVCYLYLELGYILTDELVKVLERSKIGDDEPKEKTVSQKVQ